MSSHPVPMLPLLPMQLERVVPPPPRPEGPPRCGATRRRGRRALRALLLTSTLVVAAPGLAAAQAATGTTARPTSKRLTAEGWKTYRGAQALGNADVDVDHPAVAARQLRTLAGRCAALPGRGRQSTALRATCKGSMRFLGRIFDVQACGPAGGGTDSAMGACLLGALPPMNRDLDGVAGADATVAASLLPGRCRTSFVADRRLTTAVADGGRAVLTALDNGDADAAGTALDTWSAALDRYVSTDTSAASACRPLRR